jgi:hypothetical protein
VFSSRHAIVIGPTPPGTGVIARARSVAAGTDELLANPPPFSELQVVLLRTLGKPLAVRPAAGGDGYGDG